MQFKKCCFKKTHTIQVRHVLLEFSKWLYITDCIGKYLLMEKMAFLSIPKTCFHGQNIFFDYNVTSILMKKDVVFNVRTFQ